MPKQGTKALMHAKQAPVQRDLKELKPEHENSKLRGKHFILFKKQSTFTECDKNSI